MNVVTTLLHSSHDRAMIDESDSYSHDQLKNLALRLASGLESEAHLKPGARVVIVAHNSAEFLITYLAVLAVGAVAIPLDPHSRDSERARDISLVKPELIITSSSDWVPEKYRDVISVLEFHSQTWRSYLKKKPITPVDRDRHDVAVMMMTSGASFQPRPAMLTHGSLSANLEQATSAVDLDITKKDVLLAALPMYHIFGLHVVAGLALYSGASIVISRTFDPIELAHLIEHRNVSIVPGVPALFDSFLRTPAVTIDSFSRVRLFISGGAPMRLEMRTLFYERFGSHIAEGYGLTEASPMVSFARDAQREGDIGTPLRGVEVDIRDSSGAVGLEGDVGQIVVHGDNVFAGYFGDKEATARMLDSNGWLFTGDMGVRNEDGSITLIERSNDVIVVHGFSVFPSEVENVLIQSELVDHVYVVGALDEKSGECVVAYIDIAGDVRDADDPRTRRRIEGELRDFCSERLARYKVPAKFEIIDEDSARASGRPLRKSLRSALRSFE